MPEYGCRQVMIEFEAAQAGSQAPVRGSCEAHTVALLGNHHPWHPCSAAADGLLCLSMISNCPGRSPAIRRCMSAPSCNNFACRTNNVCGVYSGRPSTALLAKSSLIYLRFQVATCRQAVWPTQRQWAPPVGCDAPRGAQAAADPALAHDARRAACSRNHGPPQPWQRQRLGCHQCPHRRRGLQPRV